MQNLASVQCAAAVLALMTCAVRANTPQYLYGASAPSTGPVTVTATTGGGHYDIPLVQRPRADAGVSAIARRGLKLAICGPYRA